MAFASLPLGGTSTRGVPSSSRRDVALRSPTAAARRRRATPLMVSQEQPERSEPKSYSPLTTAFVLTSVPALWGSYGVAVKIILERAPYASPELVNTAVYAVAAASLAATRQVTNAPKQKSDSGIIGGNQEDPKLPSLKETYVAAAELGSYLFLGSYAQLVALEYTSASRSSFLVQLTTVLVPLMDVIVLGAAPSAKMFIASSVALAGVLVLGVDTSEALSFAPLNPGDLLSLLAAVLYTVHVLRLQRILPAMPSALQLVEAKSLVQCLMSLATVAGAAALRGNPFGALQTGLSSTDASSLLALAASVLWIGAFSTAAATVAQVDGQRRVGPSISAVIFSVQPVFAVAFAMLFLHDRLSWAEVIGGALVVVSSVAVVL